MNVASALRLLRNREWTSRAPRSLIAMAVIGAIIGVVYGFLSGAVYRTSAAVSVDPQVVSLSLGTTDPAAQAVFISNFINSVTSPEAIAEASRKSGLSESEIRDHLSASQLGSTNAVEVSYQGRDPQGDGAIVRAVGESALSSYTSSGMSRLERQVQLYRDNYNAKQDAVANFVASASETDPGEHYNQVQLELIRTGNTDVNLQQELARLQPLVVGFNNLVDERVRAGNLLQGALDRQFQLQSSADFPEASISMTTASKVSALATVLRYCILFAAVGLILGVALLATNWAIIRIRSNRADVVTTSGSVGDEAEHATPDDGDDPAASAPDDGDHPVESEAANDVDPSSISTVMDDDRLVVASSTPVNGRHPECFPNAD